MLKRWIALILFLAVALNTVGALAHEPYMLYFAEMEPEDSAAGAIAWYFSDRVLEYTDHSLAVDVDTEGALGNFDECLADMTRRSEKVNIMRLSLAQLKEMGCEKLAVLAQPGQFESHGQFLRFTQSDEGAKLLSEPNEKKLKLIGLCFLDLGFYQTAFRESLSGLSDYAGRLIALESDAAAGAYQRLGANTAALTAWADGTAAGIETSLAHYNQGGLPQEAPWVGLDNHRMDISVLVISTETWGLLTKLEKQLLTMAAQATAEYSAEMMENFEARFADQAEGVHIVNVDPEAFR